MNKTASKIKDIVKKTSAEKPSFGTDPMEPWSAKYNITEDATLDRYLLSRGLNPKYVNKDIKVSHSKSNEFMNWKRSHAQQLAREEVDKKDTVTFDIPFLIRLLEYSREDAKTDMDLHHVVEKLIEIRNKGVLTMDDYEFVVKIKESIDMEISLEQLNELSPETKSSYKEKAKQQVKELEPHTKGEYGGIAKRMMNRRLSGLSKLKEDKYQDPMAATQTVGSEVDTDSLPKTKRKREMTKSARMIKSIYKKKRVKEDMYDHEKDDKGAKFGEKPHAAAILKGGKTMTGTPRDVIEIDPMMRAAPGKTKR
jgi:hypothetical protein